MHPVRLYNMSDKLFGSYGLPVSDREKPDTSKHKSDAEVGTAEDPISDELHNRHEHGHERQRSDSGTSTIDGLLFDIYDRWQYEQFRDSLDSDTFTEYSSTSDAFHGRVDSLQLDFRQKHSTRPNRVYLQSKCITELEQMGSQLQHHVTQMSCRLIRQLKSRERLMARIRKKCDVITAVLHASSLKRRIDSKLQFSIAPHVGDDAFEQWRETMRAVSKLPTGIPAELRKKVWLALAENHISSLKLDWQKTKKLAFNDRSNPDDNKLGMQIVKDLHRTGCRGFNGDDNEADRAALKRVLLAYARWNKAIGYCQGFNILVALILQVVDRNEEDALKVMMFLVDDVLPESYFANNLRALSVDMAVFRELLQVELPRLSRHLDCLQSAARDDSTGTSYEPPLTNVFTMQWFLTMFATCLPKETALRVWDCILLDSADVLLRTALAIWAKLHLRILRVQSADAFYTLMAKISQDMLDTSIINADQLIKNLYNMAPLAFQRLPELREKYTYNITPLCGALKGPRGAPLGGGGGVFSDDDDLDDDDIAANINCFGAMFSGPLPDPRVRPLGQLEGAATGSSYDISRASPGAYGVGGEAGAAVAAVAPAQSERMSLDLGMLGRQYKKLRQRQQQAHVILAAASAKHHANLKARSKVVATIESPVVLNHLFLSHTPGRRNTSVASAPRIAPLYPASSVHTAQLTVGTAGRGRTGQGTQGGGAGRAATQDGRVRSGDKRRETMGSSAVDGTAEGGGARDGSMEGGGRRTRVLMRGGSTDSEVSNTSAIETIETASNGTTSGDSDHDAVTDSTPDTPTDSLTDTPTDSLTDTPTDTAGLQADSLTDTPTQTSGPQTDSLTDTQTAGLQADSLTDTPTQTAGLQTDSQLDRLAAVEASVRMTRQRSAVTTRQRRARPRRETASTERDPPTKPTLLEIAQGRGLAATDPCVPAARTPSPPPRSPPPDPPHATASRPFNPFPRQPVNTQRRQNGVKLGLYSNTATAPDWTIGRAQINACLHRQYMARVKQQAERSKR